MDHLDYRMLPHPVFPDQCPYCSSRPRREENACIMLYIPSSVFMGRCTKQWVLPSDFIGPTEAE